MSKKIDLTRRKVLVGAGTGLAGLLSGCSTLDDELQSNQPTDENSEDSGSNDSDGEYPKNPSESAHVENGQLKYPPLVTNFRIDELGQDSATVEMNAMPNPIDDYEISVHLTPLNEVSTEWEYRVPPSEWYGGSPRYRDEFGRWTGRDTSPVLAHRVPQEHGEKVASITVPASAAGTASEKVPNLPEGVSFMNVIEGNVPEEKQSEMREWQNQVGEIGDRYDDQWFEDGALRRPESYDLRVGGRYFDARPANLPFLTDLDFSSEIPKHEPFALTFQVHDENSPDSPTIAAFTGQFMRDDDDFDYPGVLKDDLNSLKSQDFEELYESTKPAFRNFVNEYEGEGQAKGGGAKVVKEFDYFRTTSYGLYSDTLERLVDEARDRANGDTSISNYTVAPTLPVNFTDSPIQNQWSISLEITNGDAYIAQQTAEEIIRGADNKLLALIESEEIQQHEIVQELSQKLRNVCDNIGATQPTEQIRVVADFVQYMAHIQSGEPLSEGDTLLARDVPPEFLRPGAHHPVWTLYNEVGDCTDFTILMNAILQTKYFSFDMTAGVFEDTSILASEDVNHVSPAVPMSQLEIDDLVEDQNGLHNEEGEVSVYQPAPFTYRGEEYAYIEGSTCAPVGMGVIQAGYNIPPLHIEDIYGQN